MPSCRADAVLAQVRHYDRIALVLQGGGALGAYQCGVVEALEDCGVHPHWVAGISIGSINAALIAGNPPGQRAAALRTFWETVTQQPLLPTLPWEHGAALAWIPEPLQPQLAVMQGLRAILEGQRGFFLPRWPLGGNNPAKASFYDTAPLRDTLEKLVDFDRLNSGETRISVGAVNVRNGNQVVFDSAEMRLGPEHIMASGALPPGFPAVEIDGEFYWDGGVVSNTPLQWVLDASPRQDTLAFQIDLWSARGELPRDMVEVDTRLKDIRYSSRTRLGTDQFRRMQKLRRATAKLLAQMPEELRNTPEGQLLAGEADEKVYNIIQMIYRTRVYEGASKDYEFSRRTMEEHWAAGYRDMTRTLAYPEVLERPQSPDGVFTFDLKRQPGE